jgi:protease-4
MRHKLLIAIIVILILLGGSFLFGMFVYLMSSPNRDAHLFSKGQVGLVTVQGGIYEPLETIKELDEYRKDDDIKAVVIRIESPGGTVAASQELFGAIKRLAEKKPAIASMGSIAASGGYYIACGATKILANPGTITGSIGVRMDHVEIGNLLRWAKINHETLKSGKFKDIASPDRPLTPEERNLLEGMLKDIHAQFKKVVAESRGLSEEDVDRIADGRIYSGQEAQTLGLIDQLGGYSDAVALAGQLAKIEGEPMVVEKYKKRHWAESFFDNALSHLKFLTLEGKNTAEKPMLLYWGY